MIGQDNREVYVRKGNVGIFFLHPQAERDDLLSRKREDLRDLEAKRDEAIRELEVLEEQNRKMQQAA